MIDKWMGGLIYECEDEWMEHHIQNIQQCIKLIIIIIIIIVIFKYSKEFICLSEMY